LTLSNTSSFLTWSVQLIFSILLQHHISKLSRLLIKLKFKFWKLFLVTFGLYYITMLNSLWSLRRADPSSRGVLSSVCVFVSLSVTRCNNKPLLIQWVDRRGRTKKERKKESFPFFCGATTQLGLASLLRFLDRTQLDTHTHARTHTIRHTHTR
jgi:hypothetical protein